MARTSRIRIGGKQAIGFAVYAVVLAAAGVGLTRTSAGAVVGVMLIACAAVVFVMKVVLGSGRAACPTCDAMLDDLQRRRPNPSVLCRSCGGFHEGRTGALWPVEADRIADEPLFPAHAPASIAWPDGCAVCGAAATQRVALTLAEVNLGKTVSGTMRAAAAVAPLGGGAVALATTHWSVDVPHCAAHRDGAKLQSGSDGVGVDLVFRSLRYQQAFCALNVARSAPLAHFTRSSGPLARRIQSRKQHG